MSIELIDDLAGAIARVYALALAQGFSVEVRITQSGVVRPEEADAQQRALDRAQAVRDARQQARDLAERALMVPDHGLARLRQHALLCPECSTPAVSPYCFRRPGAGDDDEVTTVPTQTHTEPVYLENDTLICRCGQRLVIARTSDGFRLVRR